MISYSLLAAPLFALFSVAGTAAAQSAPCSTSADDRHLSIGPALDGFWEVRSQVGTLAIGGRVMSLPPGPATTAGITVQSDGNLTISSSELKGEYALNWVEDGQRWDFTPGADAPVSAAEFLDDEDLAALMGCEDAMTLPRLRATGQFSEPEGRIEFGLLLFVTAPDQLYGVTIGTLNGGHDVARRILSFTR